MAGAAGAAEAGPATVLNEELNKMLAGGQPPAVAGVKKEDPRGQKRGPPEKVEKSHDMNPAKRWCVTFPNYSPEDYKEICEYLEAYASVYIVGREVAPTTGMRHLQIYYETANKTRPFAFWRGTCVMRGGKPQGHFALARGTAQENYKYCSKEDPAPFTNMVKQDELEVIEEAQFRPWQQYVVDYCMGPVKKREILFIVDPVGEAGKTELARYLCMKLKATILGGEERDMFYIANKIKSKIYLIDVARAGIDKLDYAALEKIKDGLFASTKYEPEQVVIPPPHVLVFTNQLPRWGRLTNDKYHVILLSGDHKTITQRVWPPGYMGPREAGAADREAAELDIPAVLQEALQNMEEEELHTDEELEETPVQMYTPPLSLVPETQPQVEYDPQAQRLPPILEEGIGYTRREESDDELQL